jgi:hypothetical protein
MSDSKTGRTDLAEWLGSREYAVPGFSSRKTRKHPEPLRDFANSKSPRAMPAEYRRNKRKA